MIRYRRPFQLLEVMISILLFTICIVPILSSHVRIYRADREYLQDLRFDHIAQLTCAYVVQQVYKHNIPFAHLTDQQQHPLDIPFSDADFNRPFTVEFDIPYTIHFEGKCNLNKETNQEHDHYYLVNLSLIFTPISASKGKQQTRTMQLFLEAEGAPHA